MDRPLEVSVGIRQNHVRGGRGRGPSGTEDAVLDDRSLRRTTDVRPHHLRHSSERASLRLPTSSDPLVSRSLRGTYMRIETMFGPGTPTSNPDILPSSTYTQTMPPVYRIIAMNGVMARRRVTCGQRGTTAKNPPEGQALNAPAMTKHGGHLPHVSVASSWAGKTKCTSVEEWPTVTGYKATVGDSTEG